MIKLLAIAELHVGGDVRTRSRMVSWSPESCWSERELGGGSIVEETLGFRLMRVSVRARVLGVGEREGGDRRGNLGRAEANKEAIVEF